MTAEYLVQILHGVGFLTGAALYGMLLAMVLQKAGLAGLRRDDGLALVTGFLGLAWNLGALVLVTVHPRTAPALFAIAYAALGVLPAVFVHAAVRSWKGERSARRAGRSIVALAYALSGAAALAQLGEAALSAAAPSRAAFQALAAGFLVLVALMVFASPPEARRTGGLLWMAALVLFGVSAWHLGHHEPGAEAWTAVVLGHHASIPLALAILWSDYRFALADIFLKRALAVMALVAVVAGLYLGLFGAHLEAIATPVPPHRVLLALALAAGIALSYPVIRRTTGWFVDAVLLGRPDPAELRTEIARRLATCDTPQEILGLTADSLGSALSARQASWHEAAGAAPAGADLVQLPDRSGRAGLTLTVPTAEPPHYVLAFDALGGGRRVLSDDVALLESVAFAAARRLDALRWLHERCERDLREELVAKLATEAELRALQAQLNPHFLFNALNTLGYLMKAAPDRARSTLLDLTRLLRAVLKRSGGDVVTLGQEVELVESYLAIERARFEDRLQLRVEVPASLRGLPLPPLLVQPLVENAIKHGISPRRQGGEIVVKAWTEAGNSPAEAALLIEVSDTGVGASETAVAAGRQRGVGLGNVQKRLRAHYGAQASLSVTSRPGKGTRVTLRLPGIPLHRPSAVAAPEMAEERR
jgi:two-component system, LytTR family, sensor kinase